MFNENDHFVTIMGSISSLFTFWIPVINSGVLLSAKLCSVSIPWILVFMPLIISGSILLAFIAFTVITHKLHVRDSIEDKERERDAGGWR